MITWTSNSIYGLVGFQIEVKETQHAGLGAFAKKDFKKCEGGLSRHVLAIPEASRWIGSLNSFEFNFLFYIL